MKVLTKLSWGAQNKNENSAIMEDFCILAERPSIKSQDMGDDILDFFPKINHLAKGTFQPIAIHYASHISYQSQKNVVS